MSHGLTKKRSQQKVESLLTRSPCDSFNYTLYTMRMYHINIIKDRLTGVLKSTGLL